jgi:hypothetical protein
MNDVSPEQDGREPGSTRTHQAAITGGTSIGPYRLLERLGEGGMGEVWLAEQVRPVRRQVAVKIRPMATSLARGASALQTNSGRR